MAVGDSSMPVALDIKNNILEAIGDTPLVRLNKVVGDIKATVLAKCEGDKRRGGAVRRSAAVGGGRRLRAAPTTPRVPLFVGRRASL